MAVPACYNLSLDVSRFWGFFFLFPLLSLSVRLVLNRLQSVNLGITCYIFHSFYVVSAEKCVKSVVSDAFFGVAT